MSRPTSRLVPLGLLGLPLVALAYFLCAGALPSIGHGDDAVVVCGAVGLLAVAAVVLCVAWGADVPPGVTVLLALGAGLVVGALDGADAGASASVAEAVLAGALGTLLARALTHWVGPLTALLIPIVVALVDVWSVADGPSSRLVSGEPRGAAELSIDLPWWGHALGGPAARLGIPDALFLAAFATWAFRLDLRPRAAAVGMVVGLVGTLAISVAADRAVPALPLLALGYLLPNLDRLAPLARPTAAGRVRQRG